MVPARPEHDAPAAASTPVERRVSRIVIVAMLVVAVGGIVVRRTTGTLGTAWAPFVASWGVRVDPAWLIVAVVLAGAVTVLAPRLSHAPAQPWRFALASGATWLALGLSINAARGGTRAWTRVFDLGPGGSFEAVNEYLPGLPTLRHGLHVYLDRFAEVVPSQPVNVAGHPPGPLLVMDLLGIDGPTGLALLCIGLGACLPPLTYALGRALLGDERRARTAALLTATSPVGLLFGVTSFDIAFATCGALAAWLLVRPGTRPLGCAAFALASLMSWALLAVGAWTAIVAWRREGLAAAVRLALGCALSVLAVNAVLAVGWGYDPIGTLRATEQVYRDSVAQRRPYWFWVVGSPVAWGLLLGLPLVLATVRGALRRESAAIATASVVAIAAVGGFTKAETERIWLFLLPLAAVAAAASGGPWRRSLAATLMAQAIAVSVLADTIW